MASIKMFFLVRIKEDGVIVRFVSVVIFFSSPGVVVIELGWFGILWFVLFFVMVFDSNRGWTRRGGGSGSRGRRYLVHWFFLVNGFSGDFIDTLLDWTILGHVPQVLAPVTLGCSESVDFHRISMTRRNVRTRRRGTVLWNRRTRLRRGRTILLLGARRL